MAEKVAHLIFDAESIADGELIAKVRYPGQSLDPEQAVAKYQEELLEQKGTTFIPHTFQIPISVVIAQKLASVSSCSTSSRWTSPNFAVTSSPQIFGKAGKSTADLNGSRLTADRSTCR